MTEEIKSTTKRSPRLRVLGLMTSSLGGRGARVLGSLGLEGRVLKGFRVQGLGALGLGVALGCPSAGAFVTSLMISSGALPAKSRHMASSFGQP